MQVKLSSIRALFETVFCPIILLTLGFLPAQVLGQSDAEFFSHEISPIMERTGWNCHGEAVKSSGLDLSTREAALEGGNRGPAIVPGNAEESRLFRQLAGLEGPQMPLGVPLADEDVEKFRNGRW